ncbi:MAG: hypothetical protein M1837_005261 [Sclerophora amabilis]|nr:MAG: hypothetical protein M1837_005261 [Sclerophora amabilis]
MAEFSKPTFSASSYAAFRPDYPEKLYTSLLTYHSGPRTFCLDLGCGHGGVTRALSAHFTRVLGTDPSAGMIAEARSSTPSASYANVSYLETSAESLPTVATQSVDMVVAGQAAHWFDHARLFPELARVLRPGATLAFWGYQDHVFVDHPRASDVQRHYAHGTGEHLLGQYWSQPGRSIVEGRLRAIEPPAEDWDDVRRIEYVPDTKGPGTGTGEVLMRKTMDLGSVMEYVRTWSSYHAWRQAHPDGNESGIDLVDEMFEKMRDVEPAWREKEKGERWRELQVVLEWGSGILLARKR